MITDEDYDLIDRYLLNRLNNSDKELLANKSMDKEFLSELNNMKEIHKIIIHEEKRELKEKLNLIHEELFMKPDVIRLNPFFYKIIKYSVAACFIFGIGLTSLLIFKSNTGTYYSHGGGAGIIQHSHINNAK